MIENLGKYAHPPKSAFKNSLPLPTQAVKAPPTQVNAAPPMPGPPSAGVGVGMPAISLAAMAAPKPRTQRRPPRNRPQMGLMGGM